MRILLSMEEDANGSLLGKLFKSYLAYRVISYPFRKNKNQVCLIGAYITPLIKCFQKQNRLLALPLLQIDLLLFMVPQVKIHTVLHHRHHLIQQHLRNMGNMYQTTS